MCAHVSCQPVSWWQLLREGGMYGGAQTGKYFVEHRLIKRFFVFEVVIKQRLIDSGRTSDRLRARAGDAFSREFAYCGLQDRGPTLFRAPARSKPSFGDVSHLLTNQLVT